MVSESAIPQCLVSPYRSVVTNLKAPLPEDDDQVARLTRLAKELKAASDDAAIVAGKVRDDLCDAILQSHVDNAGKKKPSET